MAEIRYYDRLFFRDALQGEKLLSYSPPPPYSPKPYSSDLSKSHDNNLHVKEKSSQHDQDMQLEYHSKLKSLSQTSISQNTNLLSRYRYVRYEKIRMLNIGKREFFIFQDVQVVRIIGSQRSCF